MTTIERIRLIRAHLDDLHNDAKKRENEIYTECRVRVNAETQDNFNQLESKLLQLRDDLDTIVRDVRVMIE